jgi:hypothetical protein
VRANTFSVSALDALDIMENMKRMASRIAKPEGTRGRPRGSGLSEEQAEHLAATLKTFLPQFEDNVTRMATAWRVSQPQLSQVLNPRYRGAGIAMLVKLRAATNISIDDLIGLPPLGRNLKADERYRSSLQEALDEEANKRPELPRLPAHRPRKSD